MLIRHVIYPDTSKITYVFADFRNIFDLAVKEPQQFLKVSAAGLGHAAIGQVVFVGEEEPGPSFLHIVPS